MDLRASGWTGTRGQEIVCVCAASDCGEWGYVIENVNAEVSGWAMQ